MNKEDDFRDLNSLCGLDDKISCGTDDEVLLLLTEFPTKHSACSICRSPSATIHTATDGKRAMVTCFYPQRNLRENMSQYANSVTLTIFNELMQICMDLMQSFFAENLDYSGAGSRIWVMMS